MLKLVQTDWGKFDLAFDDPASADADAAVATLVHALLNTDAEAPDRREPDRYFRRGWWADAQAGIGLWHVRRQALSAAARAETLAMIRLALGKADPALTDLAVEDVTNAANVSSVVVAVSGRHHGRQFALRIPL